MSVSKYVWLEESLVIYRTCTALLQVFPNWVLTVLLTLVLAFMSWKLLARGIHSWQDESRKLGYESEADEVAPLLQDSHGTCMCDTDVCTC